MNVRFVETEKPGTEPAMESSPSCPCLEQRGRPYVFLALRKMTPVSIAQRGAFIEKLHLLQEPRQEGESEAANSVE